MVLEQVGIKVGFGGEQANALTDSSVAATARLSRDKGVARAVREPRDTAEPGVAAPPPEKGFVRRTPDLHRRKGFRL